MRAADHNIMYADTFISYLDRKFDISLIDATGVGEDEIFSGSKWEVLDFLEDEESAGKRWILCDTDSMYAYGNKVSIYVE